MFWFMLLGPGGKCFSPPRPQSLPLRNAIHPLYATSLIKLFQILSKDVISPGFNLPLAFYISMSRVAKWHVLLNLICVFLSAT